MNIETIRAGIRTAVEHGLEDVVAAFQALADHSGSIAAIVTTDEADVATTVKALDSIPAAIAKEISDARDSPTFSVPQTIEDRLRALEVAVEEITHIDPATGIEPAPPAEPSVLTQDLAAAIG